MMDISLIASVTIKCLCQNRQPIDNKITLAEVHQKQEGNLQTRKLRVNIFSDFSITLVVVSVAQ